MTATVSLDATVREEIRRRGQVTFAEFMSWALYHPLGGYYMTGLRTGRSGDFLTNVQVPLFAELLAGIFAEMWEKLGSDRFTLVELGASDGILAERVLVALAARGLGKRVAFHGIEASPLAREQMTKRLSRFRHAHFHESLENFEHTAGIEGCVYSNEFFDALPFHRVRREKDQLAELYIAEEGGRLLERAGALSDPALAAAGAELPDGQEMEISLAMDRAVARISEILARGFVLTVDYGAPAQELTAEHRAKGTLRGFARQRMANPLESVGETDITASVNYTRLAQLGQANGLEALGYFDQGPFLVAGGEVVLKSAVESGRAGEVKQLVDPRAFGSAFRVLLQGKNVSGIEITAQKASRIMRLGLGLTN